MRKFLLFGALFVAGAAACSGGGGGSSPGPTPTTAPTTTPTTTPTATPVPTATPTAAPPKITATGETYPAPPATLTVPKTSYAFRISIAPATSGIPSTGTTATLDYVGAANLSADPAFASIPAYTGAGSPIAYFGLVINQTPDVTFSSQQGFTVVLPANAETGSYFISAYLFGTGWVTVSGPIAGSAGQTITLPGVAGTVVYHGRTLYAYVLRS